MTTAQRRSPIPLLRAARNVAQADLATAAGISASSLSNVELGRQMATPAMLERLAAALGCPVSALTEGRFVVVVSDDRVEVRAGQD